METMQQQLTTTTRTHGIIYDTGSVASDETKRFALETIQTCIARGIGMIPGCGMSHYDAVREYSAYIPIDASVQAGTITDGSFGYFAAVQCMMQQPISADTLPQIRERLKEACPPECVGMTPATFCSNADRAVPIDMYAVWPTDANVWVPGLGDGGAVYVYGNGDDPRAVVIAVWTGATPFSHWLVGRARAGAKSSAALPIRKLVESAVYKRALDVERRNALMLLARAARWALPGCRIATAPDTAAMCPGHVGETRTEHPFPEGYDDPCAVLDLFTGKTQLAIPTMAVPSCTFRVRATTPAGDALPDPSIEYFDHTIPADAIDYTMTVFSLADARNPRDGIALAKTATRIGPPVHHFDPGLLRVPSGSLDDIPSSGWAHDMLPDSAYVRLDAIVWYEAPSL